MTVPGRLVTRTAVGHADLLRIAAALAGAGHDVSAALAGAALALGYERVPASIPGPAPAPIAEVSERPAQLESSPDKRTASPVLAEVPFWQPHSFAWHGEEAGRALATVVHQGATDGDAEDAAELRSMAKQAPPVAPPLTPWSRLAPMLQRALTCELPGRDLDVPALVRSWTRGEYLARLPRQRRRGWPALLLLLDRSFHLVPFWRDQEQLRDRLRGLVGDVGVLVRFVDESGPEGLAFDEEGEPVDLRDSSHAGLPVLAVTDLGWYGGPRLRRAWLRFGRLLRRAGEQTCALVPVPMARWTSTLAQVWSPMPWERPHSSEPTPEEHEARASRLLDLAAAARRLEPGLLRELRLLLPREAADVGTEADAWMHDDIVSMCADATALRPDRVEARLWRLGETPALRARVEGLLHAWHWHRGRRPELWHMEALSLAVSGPVVRDGAAPRAERFMANLGQRALRLSHGTGQETRVEAMRRWLDHLKGHAPAAVWNRDSTAGRGLQLAWLATHPDDDPPPDADPTLAAIARGERSGPLRTHALRQVGEWLEVAPQGSTAGRSEPEDLIASLWAASPRMFLLGHDIDPRPVSLGPTTQIRVLPASALELRTDRSTLVLRTLTLPEWASAIGRDPAGLWVEVSINGVVYRLRWIPPGRFLMGSPATEEGRWDDEGPQHEVVVSRGYWLGETPVTQALWHAVMDDNPSRFKDPALPVEQVSWDDAQRFIEFLNDSPVPTDEDDAREEEDGEHFRLPSEAEWEYACRAGTTAATYAGDGEAALDAIAWWSGNSEIQTHPVRQKQPNSWGLHDMLGNVLEWCTDAWGSYSIDSSVLVDPMTAGRRGVRRVYRGGSWYDDARNVRAAYRNANSPDFRYRALGFRLARGQAKAQGPEGQPPGGR